MDFGDKLSLKSETMMPYEHITVKLTVINKSDVDRLIKSRENESVISSSSAYEKLRNGK